MCKRVCFDDFIYPESFLRARRIKCSLRGVYAVRRERLCDARGLLTVLSRGVLVLGSREKEWRGGERERYEGTGFS